MARGELGHLEGRRVCGGVARLPWPVQLAKSDADGLRPHRINLQRGRGRTMQHHRRFEQVVCSCTGCDTHHN
eukprot:7375913-Prymnesium_polylepis.1